MQTDNSLEKSLLGKIEGRRSRGHQKIRWLDGITDAVNTNLGKLWGMVRDREVYCAAVHGVVSIKIWLGLRASIGCCGLNKSVYVFFLVGSNILLSMVVQQLFAILVFSQEMSAWSSTPSSLYPPDKIPWTGHKTYTCRFQQDTQPIIVI